MGQQKRPWLNMEHASSAKNSLPSHHIHRHEASGSETACPSFAPCRTAPHCATRCRTVPHGAAPCCTVLHRAAPCRTVPHRAALQNEMTQTGGAVHVPNLGHAPFCVACHRDQLNTGWDAAGHQSVSKSPQSTQQGLNLRHPAPAR
jgi:hypothetical protein